MRKSQQANLVIGCLAALIILAIAKSILKTYQLWNGKMDFWNNDIWKLLWAAIVCLFGVVFLVFLQNRR